MSNTKPRVRKALSTAIGDMQPELDVMRGELNKNYDSYVVGGYYLDTKEQRKLNSLLGLDTNGGINEWYKQ